MKAAASVSSSRETLPTRKTQGPANSIAHADRRRKLAFVGTLLGLFVSPRFFAVPAFVGAGLITAGVTGFCGMARILMRAPWNQSVYGLLRNTG
jgi:Protein of unknown function (DUF2892)